ncbi:RNA polymerase sigma factor region1.1 domain-containing protein, partial [Roseiflexus sp.]
LGLTPDEIAALDSASAPAADETADVSAMQPFSLEELGLTPEEIASLSGETLISAPEPSQLEDVDIDAQPFSLDDIDFGGSERTLAAGRNIGSGIGDLPPDLQPFSIEELETGSTSGHADLGELPPSLQPFSLEEPPAPQRPRMAGLTPEEAIEPPIEEEDTFLPRGFSWQQPAQRTEPTFFQSTSPTSTPDTGTIFSKLQRQRESSPLPRAEEPPAPPIAPDEHLGLFSLDDVSLRDDEPVESGAPPAAAAPHVEEQWQSFAASIGAAQPNQMASASAPSGGGEQLPAVSLEEVESIESAIASGAIQPFSFADLGLSEEEIAALGLGVAPAETETGIPVQEEPPIAAASPVETPMPPAERKPAPQPSEEVESIEAALSSGQIQPFSFADLGLSEEEIAALGLGVAPAETETGIPVQEEPPTAAVSPVETPMPPAEREPAPQPSEEVESIEAALSSGQIQPFSFADLGLSEEEIAALGLGDMAGSVQPPVSAEPETLEEPSPVIEMSEAPQTPELFVESLTDAGEVPEIEATAEPVVEETLGIEDLQPFSLADLGLSEEELAEFDLSGLEEEIAEDDEGRLGITEEELAALGTGGDLEWMPASAPGSEPPGVAFEQVEPAPESISGDDVVDRLIQIGRERGYVDIADIIAAVKDPEAEAARIDEIGRMLHAARIEIRDGDEVIDLDAEYAEEESSSMLASAAEPDAFEEEKEDLMRPFSLEELGLSDDEIAMLAAAASSAETAPSTPAEESPVTLFAPEELGAADDEIAMLAAAASDVQEAPPASAEEPLLTPFSLEELGLSEDEIALLNETAANISAQPPSAAEVEAETTAWFDLEPAVADTESVAPPEPPALDLEAAPPPVAPHAVPVPPAPPVTAAKTPAPPPASSSEVIYNLSDYPELQEYLNLLETDPDNHILRLSIARFGGQAGMSEIAMQHYRRLIKQNAFLDEVVEDLTDMIAETSDVRLLRKLHRTLGDAYSRQGRFRDAMREYGWIPGQA